MKIDKMKVYLIEFILIAVLSFALFVPNTLTRIALSSILAICAVIVWFTIKKRKTESIHSKKVVMLFAIFAVIYLIGFYLLGLYFGYYEAPLKFGGWVLLNRIIPTAVIIISSEIIRKVLLAQHTKYTNILTLITMVLVELVVYVDIYSLTTLTKFAEVVGFTFFASVACNMLYNYTANKYGILGNIVYRLMTVLYVYIIPFVPDVYIFFRSILRMLYPYVIYQVLEYTFGKSIKSTPVEDKKTDIIGKVVLGIVAVLTAMLISCQFSYGILVVASGSMSGTISTGDAVVYETYTGEQNITINDVIIFNKDGIRTVHRVIDMKNVNGEQRYITKGDANQQQDEGYITNEDIIGITKFRIAYLGYPSVWLSDMFSK